MDDEEYLLARAEYLFPDADTPEERMTARVRAATRMYEIQRAAEAPPGR